MPHAIADSDDDSDSELIPTGQDIEQGNAVPAIRPEGEGVLAGLDEPNEVNGTGSTERLRRQLLSAEHGLMATMNSAPAAPRGTAPSPSVQQGNKRRHATISGSEPVGSPEMSVKRVKRNQSYTGRHRRTIVEDDEDEVPAPTSQSVRFSEHSGFQSSTELPAGSIKDDFVNHEPAVMFRDTGSTVEDTASVQQRLLEQAQTIQNQLATSHLAAENGGDDLRSSSLAWLPASGRTPGNKEKETPEEDDGEASAGAEAPGQASHRNEGMETAENLAVQRQTAAQNRNGVQTELANIEAQHRATPSDALTTVQPHVSPVVEIPTRSNAAIGSPSNSESPQKPTKSRRRESEAAKVNSEPLNSDERDIGLPKERYVPRPSRRRATAILEEPSDYSVLPEKAAKLKRTKTTQATSTQGVACDESVQLADELKASKRTTSKPGNEASQSTVIGIPVQHVGSGDQQEYEKEQQEAAAEQNSFRPAAPPSSATKSYDESEIFVKPALPTSKAKASTRARRSHTTIFEDHVDFAGSQRSSPSLNQLQAKRISALAIAQGSVATGASANKRKRAVLDDDDDDDDDELARDDESDEEVEAPKKRGRGRPRKAPPKPTTKSADTVVDDSDVEGEVEVADETPKKGPRGRPAKIKTAALAKETTSDKENEDVQSESQVVVPGPTVDSDEPAATPQKPHSSARVIPTPSPDQHEEKVVQTTEKPVKPSPTSHSPIKNSSKVPLRVGLSRRHRIPSLLRTMKPPKR